MPSSLRAAVIHWQADELAAKATLVEQAGATVVLREGDDGRRALEGIVRLEPDVVVLWMTWKPSHSRMLAGALRATAAGRAVPVLFIEDPAAPTPPATRDALQTTIPDALFDVVERLPFWIERLARRKTTLASVVRDDKPHLPLRESS